MWRRQRWNWLGATVKNHEERQSESVLSVLRFVRGIQYMWGTVPLEPSFWALSRRKTLFYWIFVCAFRVCCYFCKKPWFYFFILIHVPCIFIIFIITNKCTINIVKVYITTVFCAIYTPTRFDIFLSSGSLQQMPC
jgi:uncharacterized membrane protein